MSAVLGSMPIALTLVMMIALRWSAARAGIAGAALAAALGVSVFGAGGHPIATLMLGALLEAAFTTLTILWILWPALAIHELQQRNGALRSLREAIVSPTAEPLVTVVLIAWFFGLFFEGAAGFGTPVALAAPLLVGVGIPAQQALVLALVGHAAGVSFGAIGTPVEAQAALVGIPSAELALYPALLTGLAAWLLIASIGRNASGRVAVGALGYAAFIVPFLLIALVLGPALPTLGGALLGGAVFAIVYLRPDWRNALRSPLWRAAAPYLTLIALVALTRAVPSVREALEAVELSGTFSGTFVVGFAPLLHPGTLLVLSFVIGALVQGVRLGDTKDAALVAARRLVPVVAALLAMLTLARLLVHSGMVEAMAGGLAAILGQVWPLAAAIVGATGTFVTGSATASNLLFSELQVSVAQRLDLSAALILGAQTFGAAAGNMIAPHNIVAGCATVGLVGREGAVLRAMIPIAAAYTALGGVLAFAFAALW